MRVGFDAHMVGQHETGNETYALGLLEGLESIGFAVDTYGYDPPPSRFHRYHRVWPRESAIRIPITTPVLAARDKLDVYHATYVLPPLLPCRGVVTVHDATFALFPEWFAPRVRSVLNLLVPRSLRSAGRVVTISEQTKRDVASLYSIPPAKIDVVYLAPRPAFSQILDIGRRPDPTFLYVGNVEPRKNVETIIRAVAVLRDRNRSCRLIIAGKPGLHFRQTRDLVQIMRLQDLVEFTGYISDHELHALYATCTALVHPALYEGFGLTPLEAMVQGTPVIAANTSSMPEVVGDAALLVDAENIEDWSEAMQAIVDNAELRARLGQAGRQNVTRFSWTRTAELTVRAYADALR